MQVTLGADPEVFGETFEGKLKSLVGLIGGSKHNPHYIDDHGGFALQEDNVAAEYNIPPATTKEQFIEYILWPQQAIARLLETNNLKISTKASGIFDKTELRTPQAQEFGCDPDYNAWTLDVNPRPKAKNRHLRSCGGHIHIGMDHRDNIIRVVRNMDKYLGVWSVIADQDDQRRQLYGKAGAFREQPHGVEYRTLSNFWIFSKELISEVYDRIQIAMNHPLIEEKSEEGKLIQKIINTNDKLSAKSYLQAVGL